MRITYAASNPAAVVVVVVVVVVANAMAGSRYFSTFRRFFLNFNGYIHDDINAAEPSSFV